ncbi:MAG: glycoside hydrolase family 3 protein, partial [Clostridiales bacterium]|nr:glycoside hydrolase family 3 protein [Clostridiales bacterium]
MEKKYKFQDETIDFKERAKDMVAQMTVEECASQLLYDSAKIERLGIPFYNWWNEALHGVARAGMATVFPQAIGLAATFDDDLIEKVADVISTEGRAKFNAYQKQGDYGAYKGLTYWSPNVNIFRDPRWGRGQETYGEDPYLTAKMGVAFVKGLQGKDEKYLKSAACAKHFAVHSGPEKNRHEFNAVASKQDMEETYLPAFKALVDCGVEGVMGAYNRTNGEPCCGSKTLLLDLLREEWGFDGYITSDCGAISDFHLYHKITSTPTESVALALNNGCDLNCGNMYAYLLKTLQEGKITEDQIRSSARRLLTTRMKLGMFDEKTPFDDIPYDVVDCKEHRALNEDVVRKSLVLLKNNGLLPLDKSKLRTIAVMGPNANSMIALEGNYHGTANQYHTILEAIREEATNAKVYYSKGCHLYEDQLEDPGYAGDRLSEVKTHIELADVVI